MRLLDLFCKAGGAGMGYHRAGFEIVGVDIEPQPNYPFEFIEADAMTFPLNGFDAIHASPPCQRYTQLGTREDLTHYPDLVDATRERLESSGKAWVIENVPGKHDLAIDQAWYLCVEAAFKKQDIRPREW